MNLLSKFLKEENGAVAAEYALIISLNAVLVISSLTNLGSGIANTLSAITAKLPAS